MKSFNTEMLALLELVEAGLWEKQVCLLPLGRIDYYAVYKLAEDQSVTGLVAAGIEHVVDVEVPREVALLFAGTSIQIEQRNKLMNDFLGCIVEKLRSHDVYTLLVKGQGVAQCYERPLWRACGDIDLFLSDKNYNKAATTLSSLATSIEEENFYNRHLSMTIDSWIVELHGTLRCGLWKSMDYGLDEVQREVFYGGKVRSWMNGHVQVFLLSADEDVVFVFSHILQHFFRDGVGLRQICDWCRLLWMYYGIIDKVRLEKRVRKMGVITEWKTFAALTVSSLGMDKNSMPMYSDDKKWKKKADKVLCQIFKAGNMGHNIDRSYQRDSTRIRRKLITFGRMTSKASRFFCIFPMDAMKSWWNFTIRGLKCVITN